MMDEGVDYDNIKDRYKTFLADVFKPQVLIIKESENIKQKKLRYKFIKYFYTTSIEAFAIIRYSLQGHYTSQTHKTTDIIDVFKTVVRGNANALDGQFVRDVCAITKQTPHSIIGLIQGPDIQFDDDVDQLSLYYLKRLAHKEVSENEVLELYFNKFHKNWKIYKKCASMKDPRFVVLEQQVKLLRSMDFEVLNYNPGVHINNTGRKWKTDSLRYN